MAVTGDHHSRAVVLREGDEELLSPLCRRKSDSFWKESLVVMGGV